MNEYQLINEFILINWLIAYLLCGCSVRLSFRAFILSHLLTYIPFDLKQQRMPHTMQQSFMTWITCEMCIGSVFFRIGMPGVTWGLGGGVWGRHDRRLMTHKGLALDRKNGCNNCISTKLASQKLSIGAPESSRCKIWLCNICACNNHQNRNGIGGQSSTASLRVMSKCSQWLVMFCLVCESTSTQGTPS